ncbi:DUF262 domain-containing protein [Miniphocaeibacter massiliensis]|uniref:DUF262 domain-containing protein n=1 Tax=Miniphocaeibacter massiliensis TaxID=2041841 RepID=UPI000C1C23DC|nr:DUF262 domain-containing protein [Miniphocaeibacter massiliensis]
MSKIKSLIELLNNYFVEIPIIQRDYAQGREDFNTTLIRDNLLSDIKASLKNDDDPLDLNFVYGKMKDDKFIPLDGQQRLTTLFLLHLYAFRNNEIYTDVLMKFTYETRKSSRKFFESLIKHRSEVFDFNETNKSSVASVADEVRDSEWFISEWENDPTVKSTLVMLNAIETKFADMPDLGERLLKKNEKPLIFQFLEMDKLGMEDSLYIKLNARGKLLTPFENFKARLFSRLRDFSSAKSNEFENLFDGAWTDFFWREYKNNFDESFLNFFQVLFSNNQMKLDPENWANGFDFKQLDEEIFDRIIFTLNVGSKKTDSKISQIIIDASSSRSTYSDRLMFHALVEYLFQKNGKVSESIHQWLRVLENLIVNSPIDSTATNLAAIRGINDISKFSDNIIEHLIKTPKISGFYSRQINEEIQKAKIIYNSEDDAKVLYQAEKHPYFTGTIRAALVYGYKNELFNANIFEEYWGKIDVLFEEKQPKYEILLRQALLCFCDYTLPISKFKTLCINDPKEGSSTYSLKRLFSDEPAKVKDFLDKISIKKNLKEQMLDILNSSIIGQNDWRYCLIRHSGLFDKMSKNHLRLFDSGKRILLVPNKWTNGYNLDLYLSTLDIELKKNGIITTLRHEIGTYGDIWLEYNDVEIRYKSGSYKISSQKDTFITKTGDLITEALEYMADMFPLTK